MKVLRSFQKKSKGNPNHLVSTSTLHPTGHVYYFGSFCLNQAERLLLRHGSPIPLTPKVFDVLLVLVQNSGCLVTKDKLLKEVWPDTFVEEANLSVNIASLRKALDEGVAKCQYIQTVSKGGYRFVASVAKANDESDGTVNPRLSEQLFVIEDKNGSERDHVLNSVAVLPFDNETCDPEAEYLSAGLTESIINNLSQFQNLRVMARNSVCHYQRKDIEPRTVGHELGVCSVLTGRILRFGDRLIIRTELVDVMNGWQLWGEQYQPKVSDILLVQAEMAKEISERLRTKLTIW
ncbi:MAG TPA: winged helix-turn-helix domain-containing protein [Pyrinomonadaceae bacterium]|nr:winged helix-turn-helix domain-containing protein [Pyrinomonadaceae bacterium]